METKKKLLLAVTVGLVAGYIVSKKRNVSESSRKRNNSKNALIVASVASMIDQFNIPNIKLLISLGYNVDVATNFVNGSTCSDEKIRELVVLLDDIGVDCYHIDFDRNVTDVRAGVKSFHELDRVVCGLAEPINKMRHHHIKAQGDNTYTFIHSHSPIGGVVGRITGKRHGIKNIYSAHGFHFYDGAPLRNWLLYYPVELGLSWITDVLITINKEDYTRAKKRFHARRIIYIPGVGIDTTKYDCNKLTKDERKRIREKLGIKPGQLWLLSVGELNDNKNHEIVIKAIGQMSKSFQNNIFYTIAGRGPKENALSELILSLNLQDNVKLLGFRNDISDLYSAADVFIHPSFREGLSVALMEAMSSGLPAIASKIRGNTDLIDENGGVLFCPDSVNDCKMALDNIIIDKQDLYKKAEYNRNKIMGFSTSTVMNRTQEIYENIDK